MDIFLSSFTRILEVGYKRTLLLSDLPELPAELSSRQTQLNLSLVASEIYAQDIATRGPGERQRPVICFCRVVLRAHGAEFLFLGFLKLVTCLLSFVGPVLLNQIVSLVENDPSDSKLFEGLVLVGILFVGLALLALAGAQYNIYASLFQIKIRGALTRAIFAKAMTIPQHELAFAAITEGEIANMVQIDVSKISDVIVSLHDLWNLPLLLIIAFVLLYYQVKIGFLAGVAVILIMIPINSWIASKIGEATAELMIHKDSRVSYISDAIRGMKSVKMLGLESIVYEFSLSLRDKELYYLSIRKYLDAVCVFLWASLPVLVPFFTFLTTIFIGEDLTASEVFTTIALLNMLIFPMNAFPWVINGVVEASVSTQRVLKLLCIQEGYERTGLDASIKVDFGSDAAQMGLDDTAVLRSHGVPEAVFADTTSGNIVYRSIHTLNFNNMIAVWSRRSEDRSPAADDRKRTTKMHGNDRFVLGPLNMRIPELIVHGHHAETSDNKSKEFLVSVCGAVGSGKSMFLRSILRETLAESGFLNFFSYRDHSFYVRDFNLSPAPSGGVSDSGGYERENISFCPHIPGMYSGSLRRNITLGSEGGARSIAMQRRYDLIFRGCCLSNDFYNSETTAPDERGDRLSDLVEVGQNGNRLSGGQRLRVGVARALFNFTPIVVLDDPFSALDDATARSILSFLKDFSRTENRLILFSTHKLHLLGGYADKIVFLEAGKCKACGTLRNLLDDSSFADLLNETEAETTVNRPLDSTDVGEKLAPELYPSELADNESFDNSCAVESESGALKVESANVGHIKTSVYRYYLGAAGIMQVSITVFSTFLMQVTAILMQYWLAYWVANSDTVSDNRFLIVFGVICVANVGCALIRSFSFAKAGLDATRSLYVDLTKSVLFAPLTFFEITSLGRIINRFGKETERIDDNLPFVANIVLAQFFSFTGAIIIISISNYLMVVVIGVALVRYYNLQHFYRSTSREVRRLESTYRSPLYTLISDCLGDSVSIRACHQMRKNLESLVALALDESLRVSLMSCYCAQWLNIRLQLLGAIITTSVGLLAVVCSIYGIVNISPGLFGLALALSFSLVRNLNSLVTSVTETEQEIISVERVHEYCGLRCEFMSEEVSFLTVADPRNVRCGGCCCRRHRRLDRKCVSTSRLSLSQSFLNSAGSIGGSMELIRTIANVLGDSAGQQAEESMTPLLGGDDSTVPTESGKASFDGRVEFIGLSLSYEDVDNVYTGVGDNVVSRYALSDVNIMIPPGSRVALLGATGSGKTSLFRALLGLNRYTGSLRFGEVELRDIPLSVLRGGLIGAIPQDPFLFNGSIRYNLDPYEEFEDFELRRAIEMSNLADTFSGLEHCTVETNFDEKVLDEEIGNLNHGSKLGQVLRHSVTDLSTGQRQLVCLARCILRDTKLVLVDEATSSLDPQAEENLFKVLVTGIPWYTTVIIICHNPKAVAPFCNLIIELEKGSVKRYQLQDAIL